MGFETLNLADVKLDKPAPVPVGKYVFTVQPGAAYRFNEKKGNIQELNVRFDVTGGDQNGRVVWFAYPDPASTNKEGKLATWSAQALKKLEIALGVDIQQGEDTAAYLNRVAGSRITAEIKAGRPFKDKTTNEDRVGDPQFSPFTVGPAA